MIIGAPRSSQNSPHPRLVEVVRRHLDHPDRTPIPAHTRAAFDRVAADPRTGVLPLMLDSGCGTGLSTHALAHAYPEALVIGVDRSAERLARRTVDVWPDNVLRTRAELGGFWRLAAAAGWSLKAHYLLHPNPWPKPGHLGRRWHAHPAFPALLALGGRLELRCNWRTYALEFAQALAVVGIETRVVSAQADRIDSAFERKYRAAGDSVWQVVAELPDDFRVRPD